MTRLLDLLTADVPDRVVEGLTLIVISGALLALAVGIQGYWAIA